MRRRAAAPRAQKANGGTEGGNFKHALLHHANLVAAKLSGATLDHTDFTGANLANATLKGASLRFAALKEAKLDSADLSGADLRYARLNQADLTAANLTGSALDYADFAGANLADADLRGAQLRYAKNLTPAQLEQARTDESTVRPFHYLELAPLSPTRGHARGWNRPLMAAALAVLACLAGALAWLDLARQPQRAVSHTAPAIAPKPNMTPILASLTPSMLLSGRGNGPAAAARGVAPVQLAALPLYRTILARTSQATASETPPAGLRALPAQRLTDGVRAQILSPSLPEIVPAVDGPLEKVALKTPGESTILSDAQAPVIAALPVKLTIPVKEKAAKKKSIVPSVTLEPLTMVVSLSQQKLDLYRGTTRVTTSKISSGKRGHETKVGVFSILEKRRHHRSNLYSNAPMPWMQRMTWSGTALHGGVVPGYPASHGCIRLPFSFAPKLFKLTSVGENVVVTHARVTPKPIAHKALFQPARTAPQVAAVNQDHLIARAATNATPQGPGQGEADVYDLDDGVPAAPLRMLITRRTLRDRIIGTQYVLASLGYLRRQNFTGRVGRETIAAIRAFQKAQGLKVTGTYSEDVAKAIYRAAGKADPPPGHLFVRQEFRRVFDVPVDFRLPEQSLGTHVFTALKFSRGAAETPWMAISLEGDDSLKVLDRIEIPGHVRKQISERLTPGSTLIIAEDSSHSAILRKGDDFIVASKEEPIEIVSDPRRTKAKPVTRRQQAKPATIGTPRVQTRRTPPARRSYRHPPKRGIWSFRRW